MSLFRTERWVAAICPGQVALYKANGQAGAAAEEITLDCTSTDEADTPLWAGALAAIERWVQTAGGKRRSLHIVLSNRFARFARVPWSAAIQTRAESEAVAQLTLESLYGDMQGWTVSQDDGEYNDYGKARLVCALETALLTRLRSVLEGAGASTDCRRIEPYFVTCWNRWCATIDADAALFSVVEADGHAVLATLRHGDWQSVRALRTPPDEAALNSLHAREILLQGFDSEPRQWSHRVGGLSGSVTAAESAGRLAPDRIGASPALTMARVGGGA